METTKYDTFTFRELQSECKKRGIKASGKRTVLVRHLLAEYVPFEDKYTKYILISQYNLYRENYHYRQKLIDAGIPIRHANLPEDISENLTKFIIQKYEGDDTCKWAKGINKKVIYIHCVIHYQ